MAYDENLARRVQKVLEKRPGFVEKKMFGGIGYLLNGNMACGVLNNDLIVRVGPAAYEESLKMPDTRKFDITGKPMKGWIMVSGAGSRSEADLLGWVQRGANFALSLPAKQHIGISS